MTPDPEPAAASDPETGTDETAGPEAAGAPDPAPEAEEEPTDPGVSEAVGGVRAAFMRMLDAHITLLRAELEITGKELGVILGLAFGALVIAVLAAILLYVGSFLFFGDLLFGSMGWGIIHGTLLAAAVIGFVVINLAGGQLDRYGWGAVVGLAVGVLLAVVMISNVGNTGGEAVKDWLTDNFVTEGLPFGDAWLVALSGLVIGGLIALAVAAVIGWRSELRGRALLGVSIAGFVLGAFIGTIWLSTRYQAPGVLGLAITVGMLTWIIVGAILASRAGFDTEARYANLIPRESIAAFEKTKDFMSEQWEVQKSRMLGR